jgi:APA family basic amino acid/polyamine antiporter
MSTASLPRVVGIGGAVLIGLGSIIGTGVFVTIGIAAGLAGPAVILAIALAAVLATANGLSSAQLAANHAVSGGTYEYGHRYLNPTAGFIAGWTFLCAKTSSAATTSMGFAGYFLSILGFPGSPWQKPVAVMAVVLITALVLTGVKRSNRANFLIVANTLLTLLFFILICLPGALANGGDHLSPFFKPASADHPSPWPGVLEATAIMFVAYTGYGRVATMGEEVHHPRRTIPIAMVITLLVSMAIYMAVALAGVAAAGIEVFAADGQKQGVPLERVATAVRGNWAGLVMAIGAVTAMLGVLLNVTQGMSRVVLAMGRRRDLPSHFARLDRTGRTPAAAVLLVAGIVVTLIVIGDVKSNWSFSAFTVLIYYAITNLAALRLSPGERLFPRWIAATGLIGCVFVAFWVEPRVWMIGLGLISVGLVWHAATRWRRGPVS